MQPADLVAASRQLATSRLRLECSGIEHAQAFCEALNASLPELRWIGWAQQLRELAWAERFCASDRAYVERGEGLVFQAFEAASGHYVGRIDLHTFDFDAPRCEVGYVADTRRAGRGLMREAVLAVVKLGFELGLARIQALSERDNLRALRFAEQALGFTREGELRHYERNAQGRLGVQVLFAAYNSDAG
jgi:RimJ/RimL family protein N-acetyltransferase